MAAGGEERCTDCECVMATEADGDRDCMEVRGQACAHCAVLCWAEYNATSCNKRIDWRTRALRAEEQLTLLTASRDEMERLAQKRSVELAEALDSANAYRRRGVDRDQWFVRAELWRERAARWKQAAKWYRCESSAASLLVDARRRVSEFRTRITALDAVADAARELLRRSDSFHEQGSGLPLDPRHPESISAAVITLRTALSALDGEGA